MLLLVLGSIAPQVLASSIINEQWSSYNSSYWTTSSGGSTTYTTSGGYLIQYGNSGGTESTYYQTAFTSTANPAIRFESRVRMVSPAGSGGNTQILWYGLANGKSNSQFDSNGRYIAFYVSSASGGWCVKYANGGSVQTPYSGGSWAADTWYNLTMTKEGDVYKFYIDSNLVYNATIVMTSFTTFYSGFGGEFRNSIYHESDYWLIDTMKVTIENKIFSIGNGGTWDIIENMSMDVSATPIQWKVEQIEFKLFMQNETIIAQLWFTIPSATSYSFIERLVLPIPSGHGTISWFLQFNIWNTTIPTEPPSSSDFLGVFLSAFPMLLMLLIPTMIMGMKVGTVAVAPTFGFMGVVCFISGLMPLALLILILLAVIIAMFGDRIEWRGSSSGP
jgi:hypothetical protein